VELAMMDASLPTPGFQGFSVVTFESRRATDMARLIEHYGGLPVLAPAVREVPLQENPAAFVFADALLAGEVDVVIFLTGVGVRTLLDVLDERYAVAELRDALARITVVVRGPKPAAVLRELDVPIAIRVPEPNTWRDLLRELDQHAVDVPVRGRNVAVQEYGLSNPELLTGLEERGARIMRVPVYRWDLPQDTMPLRQAIQAIIAGRVQVALFTSAIQVTHLLQVAAQYGWEEALRHAFTTLVTVSVGPTTTEALLAHNLPVDLQPPHPKMGPLVKAAAEGSSVVWQRKHQSNSSSTHPLES
jgi:uroporphyrinogen-III synthase